MHREVETPAVRNNNTASVALGHREGRQALCQRSFSDGLRSVSIAGTHALVVPIAHTSNEGITIGADPQDDTQRIPNPFTAESLGSWGDSDGLIDTFRQGITDLRTHV